MQEVRLRGESCEEVLAEAQQRHQAETKQLREALWASNEEVGPN